MCFSGLSVILLKFKSTEYFLFYLINDSPLTTATTQAIHAVQDT